jgi:hypothetical protein
MGLIVSCMEQSPARGEDLSDLERALIDSVANGIELDLAVAEPVDEAAMKAWGESKTVRASVIRDVLRGRHRTLIHMGCGCGVRRSSAGWTSGE